MPECTFAPLSDVLLGLGYSMRNAAVAIIFEHPPASARLIMETFDDAEAADAATLVVVRRNLDDRGIMPRARFDELLRQRIRPASQPNQRRPGTWWTGRFSRASRSATLRCVRAGLRSVSLKAPLQGWRSTGVAARS